MPIRPSTHSCEDVDASDEVEVDAGSDARSGSEPSSGRVQESLEDVMADDVRGDRDGLDAEGEFDGQQPLGARAPYRPSAREVDEHNLTHCPPRAWCDHCVKGQFKNRQHRLAHGEAAESSVPRINMDYFSLKDDVTEVEDGHVDKSTARVSMTCLCMKESMCGSVWGYAVSQKGSGEEMGRAATCG